MTPRFVSRNKKGRARRGRKIHFFATAYFAAPCMSNEIKTSAPTLRIRITGFFSGR
jgi:hypothetical protein